MAVRALLFDDSKQEKFSFADGLLPVTRVWKSPKGKSVCATGSASDRSAVQDENRSSGGEIFLKFLTMSAFWRKSKQRCLKCLCVFLAREVLVPTTYTQIGKAG